MFYKVFNLFLIFTITMITSCTAPTAPEEVVASVGTPVSPVDLQGILFPGMQNTANFYDVTTYNTFAHRISRNAAVRVQVDYGGILINGSGTYFKWKGHNIVITAAHLYALGGGAPLRDEAIITSPSEKVMGKLLYIDKQVDIAVFAVPELKSRKAAKLNRAKGYEIGEPTVYSGFPGPNNLLTFDGTMSGEGYNTDIAMHSFAWPGSSGSGVFNANGEFIGVVVAIMVGGGPTGAQLIGSVVYVAPATLIDSAYLLQNLRKLEETPMLAFNNVVKYFSGFLALLCGILALTSCSNNIDYTFQIPQENIEVDIWTDSFIQVGAYENMDIIWVIDDSCSMADNDKELLAGIEAMMNNLPPDMDWRLKMITAGAFGTKQSTTFPLTQGADYQDALDMYSKLPYDGGEAGFTSIQNYILYDTYAQTWLRDDAALLVVFVSDEEEQSLMTVSDFTIWYRSTRETAYIASIVNVDPALSLCSYHFSTANTGFRYMEATSNFNGNVIDICSSDWSAGVQEATSELQPYDSLELSHLPWEDTIVVFEDGIPHSDWYYDSLDNTIYLNTIPNEGSLVEMSYSIKEYLVQAPPSTVSN